MKRDTILIVDDVEVNRWILAEIFQEQYQILEAGEGQEALEKLRQNYERIAIILLDLIMPGMNGYEILDVLKENEVLEEVPVILITGDSSEDLERRGYDLGVSDIVQKPFDVHVVKKRVQNVIDMFAQKHNLEDMVAEQTKKLLAQNELLKEQAKVLEDVNNNMIDTLSELVEFRNMETGRHIHNIKTFTKILGDVVQMQCPEYNLTEHQIEVIERASAMHDIGKIVISDTVLLKPGRLTPEEFDVMKTHTVRGCDIMESIVNFPDKDFFKYAYNICRYHHERYDGRGYPEGLVGEDIPVEAQIVGIADVYEALISPRVYKPPFDTATAFRMIIGGECGTFSPKMLECLEIAKEQFISIQV